MATLAKTAQAGSAREPGRTADQNQQARPPSWLPCPRAAGRRGRRQLVSAASIGTRAAISTMPIASVMIASRSRPTPRERPMPAPSAMAPARTTGPPMFGRATAVEDRPCRHAQPVHQERPKVQQAQPDGPGTRNRSVAGRRPGSTGTGRQSHAGRVHVLAGRAPRRMDALAPRLDDAASRPCGCIRAIRSRRASCARRTWVFSPERPRLAMRAAKAHATRHRAYAACGRIVAAMGRQNQRPINPIGSSHAVFFSPRGMRRSHRDPANSHARSPRRTWHPAAPALQSCPTRKSGNAWA